MESPCHTYYAKEYMYQPKAEARVWYHVARVYTQRLGDMTEEDARKEGGYTLEEFKKVWEEINETPWNPDEVVYVYEFERVEPLSRSEAQIEESSISKCWSCGKEFEDDDSLFCDECQTFICPSCGTHYCTLPEVAKRTLDAEMYSLGLWDPYSDSPKRKKRRRSAPIEVAREDERARDILRRAGYRV